MSSFVCSDHTILAITQGMHRHRMIEARDRSDVAESLRFINEYQTTKRYARDGETKKWMVECDHRPVTAKARKYPDGEVLAAIGCYLYQIDTCSLHDFDFITMVASVKLLREKILESGTKSGDLLVTNTPWGSSLKVKVEGGEYIDILDLYDWDLAE